MSFIRSLASRGPVTVVLAVVVSVLLAVAAVEAATTISNNISTGGTLTVSGAVAASSTLQVTGAITTYGGSTFGDAAADINLFTGALHASSTALFTSGLTSYGDLTISQTATTTVTFPSAGINFDSNTFVIDPNANRVGVRTSGPNTEFEVAGTASSTNLVVGGGTSISRHISATASLDFAVIAANSCQTQTITATGAADGDTVSLGLPNALATASSTLAWSGWVSAANTVSVRVCQVAASGTSDPAAATVRADVWKH